MKKFVSTICSLFLLSITSSFQISGNTDDGREVLLESDGSWKFSNAKRYTKSLLATKTVESRVVPLKVSYNPAQWDCKLGIDGEEFLISLKNKEVFVELTTSAVSLPCDMSKDIIIETATCVGGEINILTEEDRFVNGIPVKYFEYDIKIDGADLSYMSYMFAGENATVLFAAFAYKDIFPRYKNTVEELLNGLAPQGALQ